MYEAIIKVKLSDPPERQATDIAGGIGAACVALTARGWSTHQIVRVLEDAIDEVFDAEDRAVDG